jgi:hypothetical protein
MNIVIGEKVRPGAQVKSLTKLALILSSIAAIPGLVASLYPAYYLFISLVEGPDGGNWLTPLALIGSAAVGWWLYWTYWLEFRQKNKHGKITWLVSALFNSVGVILLTGTLFSPSMTSIRQYIFVVICILFLATMMVLSLRIWILEVKS